MTPSGIDPATLWFVAQCLNQLRYRDIVQTWEVWPWYEGRNFAIVSPSVPSYGCENTLRLILMKPTEVPDIQIENLTLYIFRATILHEYLHIYLIPTFCTVFLFVIIAATCFGFFLSAICRELTVFFRNVQLRRQLA
jgi:hypothetical protein